VAKLAIQGFCRRISADAAANRFQLRRLTTRALELALEARDWPQVAACKAQLHTYEVALATGIAVRTHIPLADGELPDIFHLAAEGRHGPSPGLCSIKTATGDILTSPASVEAEVTDYFSALFQGRHVASPDGQVDSGHTFQPDEALFPAFLDGLPSLSVKEREALEQYLTLGELQEEKEGAAPHKSPGLDILSELYKATFTEVGPPLLNAFNAMLAEGILTASLRQGAVRQLPKVAGVPMGSQLRPITLLSTDYKLLTRILVASLIPVLPSVLRSTKLCSVRDRSIFDGPASILSSAEYLHRHQKPGYLLSLDFFHAYDRVSLPLVDKQGHGGHGIWGHLQRLGGHPPSRCLSSFPPPQHLSLHPHPLLHQAGGPSGCPPLSYLPGAFPGETVSQPPRPQGGPLQRSLFWLHG
jgi:hypothetical protein